MRLPPSLSRTRLVTPTCCLPIQARRKIGSTSSASDDDHAAQVLDHIRQHYIYEDFTITSIMLRIGSTWYQRGCMPDLEDIHIASHDFDAGITEDQLQLIGHAALELITGFHRGWTPRTEKGKLWMLAEQKMQIYHAPDDLEKKPKTFALDLPFAAATTWAKIGMFPGVQQTAGFWTLRPGWEK